MSPQVARYTGLSPPLLPFIPSLKDPSPTISRNGRPFVRMIGKSIGKMIGWLVGQNRSDLGRKYNGEQDKYVSSAGRGNGGREMVKKRQRFLLALTRIRSLFNGASRFSFRN